MRRLITQNVYLQIKRCISNNRNIAQSRFQLWYQLPKDKQKNQSTIVDVDEGVRCSSLCTDGQIFDDLGDAETVFESFKKGVSLAADNDFLGWRPTPGSPYSWLKYKQVDARSKAFGDGLINLGVLPGNNTRIGVHSQNRPEYFITDMGFLHHSICPVPIYNQMETKNLTFIINHAEMKTLVVDDSAKVKQILTLRADLPNLERIIMYEPVNPGKREAAESLGLKLYHIEEVEEIGLKNPLADNPPKPDDWYIVCYTSGTTGEPKGVIITHENINITAKGIIKHLMDYGMVKCSPSDVMLSFLPLAHIYERFLELMCFRYGARIGYFQGDSKKLLDDLLHLKPTLFPCVPRVLNRINDKVLLSVMDNPVKKFLFKMAMKSKQKDIDKGIVSNNTIWDKLVFANIQARLGGRVRFITTGSAPLSDKVLHNMRCYFGCPVLQGYGMTECSGCASISVPGDHNTVTVGPPLPNTFIKLIDVPEMNYFVKNNRGEVCLKGPTLFKGYLHNEVKTKEAFTEDNWLKTGDIGQWTPEGSLVIVDRRKHLFKLSQGVFVAPEKVENVLTLSPYLLQAYVYGDGTRDYLVCVAVVDPDTLPGLAEELGITGTLEELCKQQEIKKALMKSIQRLFITNQLTQLEQVKKFHLTSQEFTVDNSLLTPTLKLKRTSCAEKFKTVIEDMYSDRDTART